MKTSIWIGLMTLSLALPKVALANGGPGGGHLRKVLAELNLSEEQKAKIKEVRESHGKSMKESRSALRDARKAMEEAVKIDASRSDLLKKFESLQALRNKMGQARFEMILAVREILTPEQRQKFRAAFQNFGRHHRHGGEGKGEEKEED